MMYFVIKTNTNDYVATALARKNAILFQLSLCDMYCNCTYLFGHTVYNLIRAWSLLKLFFNIKYIKNSLFVHIVCLSISNTVIVLVYS